MSFAMLSAALVAGLADLAGGNSRSAVPLLAGILVTLGTLWINKRGHTAFAGSLLVSTLLAVLTILLFNGQGIHDISILLYPLLMILISLLFDRRSSIFWYSLVVISVGLVVFGEVSGLFHPRLEGLKSRPADFIIVSVILVVAGISLSLVHGFLNASLEQSRKNSQALQASEARFRSLAENAPNLIVNIDRRGTVLYSNRVSLQPDEYLEQTCIFDYLPVADQSAARQLVEQVFLTGELSAYEGQILFSRKIPDWYSFRLGPIRQDNMITSLVMIATSIQKRIEIEEELKNRTDQLTILNSIAVAISSLSDLNSVLDEILIHLRGALRLDAFYVALLDETGEQASFPIMYDAGQRYAGKPLPVTPGGWIDQVVSTREPFLLNRTEVELKSTGYQHMMGDTTRLSASVMVVPLIIGERTIGVVSAQSYTLNAFGQTQVDFLQSAASQIAVAVDNARLYETLQCELAERKRSETALRQSEARLRALIENFPYDLWMCDTQGRYILQSSLSLRMAGNILGKRVAELNAPEENIRTWVELHRRVLAGETIMDEGEWPVDGEMRSFATMLAPALDDGEMMGFVGLNIDITDLKRSEEKLRRYAARIEILHELDQAILAVRSSQEIAEAALNRLPRLLPCSSASLALISDDASTVQVVATYIQGETHPGSGAVVAFSDPENLARLAEGQSVYLTNLVTQPLDRSASLNRVLLQGPIRASIVVPLLHQNKLVGVLSVGADRAGQLSQDDVLAAQEVATQLAIAIYQAQLTMNIQELNADLERRVLERTVELQAAVEELEAFSFSVSHDLRAPLRAMIGYLQLFMEDYGSGMPAEALDFIQRIQSSAQNMNQLIDEMLNLARVGRHTLQRSTFNLADLFREVLDVSLAGKDSQRFQITLHSLPDVEADRGLLRQVCQNLVDNAIKYSRNRTVSQVEIGSLLEAGKQVFYVRDNGAGFDMKYAGRLFHAFERLHRQDEYEGTGVGLAIVKRIVQRHGGRVWVQAAPDQGATFYFALES